MASFYLPFFLLWSIMEADDNDDEQHTVFEEDVMEIADATIDFVKERVCHCLNKSREDDLATTIFSRCEQLVPHAELLEENKTDNGYSLKDIHFFHMVEVSHHPTQLQKQPAG